mmetsp:Transcript_22398/g.63627  ORF Transcript_22398/g.63627 Transcript_22398/m.63627 type:complete len:136 (+) Transcript_22398:80-487(+)
MGNASCCQASEVKASQKDMVSAKSAMSDPNAEEDASPVAPGATGSQGLEWTIQLVKADGKRLGVDVDLSDGKTLVVDCINEGLMKEWNEASPSLAVKASDRILSINGVEGDSNSLTDECKRSQKLEMRIQRSPLG